MWERCGGNCIIYSYDNQSANSKSATEWGSICPFQNRFKATTTNTTLTRIEYN